MAKGRPVPHIGLFRVHWKRKQGGGSSLAAIGMSADGSFWIAPTNWIEPASWAKVETWVKQLESFNS